MRYSWCHVRQSCIGVVSVAPGFLLSSDCACNNSNNWSCYYWLLQTLMVSMHAVDFTGKMISLRQTLARMRWLHCIVLLGKSVENIFLSHKKSSQFIVLNQLYIFSSSQTADVRNNSNKHNGGKRYKKFCCETNSQILGFARLQKKQKEENKMLTPTTLNWYQLFTQQVKRLNHFLSGSILY